MQHTYNAGKRYVNRLGSLNPVFCSKYLWMNVARRVLPALWWQSHNLSLWCRGGGNTISGIRTFDLRRTPAAAPAIRLPYQWCGTVLQCQSWFVRWGKSNNTWTICEFYYHKWKPHWPFQTWCLWRGNILIGHHNHARRHRDFPTDVTGIIDTGW